jgi:chorismate mutase
MPDGRTVRALHGVAYAPANTPVAIRAAVRELLRQLPSDPDYVVISAVFTSTHGLDAAFPATAARESGPGGAA